MGEWTETLLRGLLDSSLRIVLVGIAAAVILTGLRIRSSSVRHATWALVLATMLLMPALPQFVPPVAIPMQLRTTPVHAIVSYVTQSISAPAIPEPRDVSEPAFVAGVPQVPPLATPSQRHMWPNVVVAIYFSVIVLLSIRLFLGWRCMWCLAVGARKLELQSTAQIYESKLVSTPMTIGLLAPRILLPPIWSSWSKEKLNAILAHETAHIRRRDPVTGFLARLNCTVFWFHPLAWWLQQKLAATAEHACDDVALETIESPRQYIEILLETAEAVRRGGGRFSSQAAGVHGNGLLEQRIGRILRHEVFLVSKARKLALMLSCAAVICIVVACREQSSTRALPPDIEADERQAVARLNAERTLEFEQQKTFLARQNAVKAAQAMTLKQAAELESKLKTNPEDIQVRETLLYFYSASGNGDPRTQKSHNEKIIPRRRHLLWFIVHHPDSNLLGTPIARVNPTGSGPVADPEGYAAAKDLWLSQTGRADTTLAVLGNAAYFFEVADKPIAEQLLRRARTMDAGNKWSIRLGRVYALALLGVNDAVTNAGILEGNAVGDLVILSMDLTAARDPFNQYVRETLASSKDGQMLSAAASYLMLHPLGTTLGTTYLERAVRLDPNLVTAHSRLLQIRSAERYPQTRAAIRRIDKEKKYAAISTLPDAERFVMLREMAEYSHAEAFSLEFLDPDGARAARERARKYAESLLKLAPRFRDGWGNSAAVFSADVVAGSIAAGDGDTKTALQYLRDASKISSSEEMAYLVPLSPMRAYRQLCKALIDAGYRSDVLTFLEHFATINISQRDFTLRMAADVRAGKTIL
jgi:hypothetical protein